MKKNLSTREKLTPVAQNLYRHVSGEYYAIKMFGGVKRIKALETSDRKTADRFLIDWIADMSSANAPDTNMSLDALLNKFPAVRSVKPKTAATDASIIRNFRATFPKPMTALVARVTTADLLEWLKIEGAGKRNSTVVRYRLFLHQLFDVAVNARAVSKTANPFDPKAIRVKKKEAVKRPMPTDAEFQKIIAEIRTPGWKQMKGKRGGQRPMEFAESADFIEFEGEAGVGQGEASTIHWEDIDERMMHFVRMKTENPYSIPVFSKVRVILERVRARRRAELNGAEPTGPVFLMRDGKKALTAATKRLGLRHYCQRNLRSMFIVRNLERGVAIKTIAEWQGHQDGGVLIMRTYSDVIKALGAAREYEDAQIALAEGKVVMFPGGGHKAA